MGSLEFPYSISEMRRCFLWGVSGLGSQFKINVENESASQEIFPFFLISVLAAENRNVFEILLRIDKCLHVKVVILF